MSSPPEPPASPSLFQSILDAALIKYEKKINKNLSDKWVTEELKSCKSVENVLDKIQDQAEAFDKLRNCGNRLTKCISSSVGALEKVCSILGDVAGKVYPHAQPIFTAIAYLLGVAKSVKDSHDALEDLFERIHFFLKRVGVYTQISPIGGMVELLVNMMAEVIFVLAIATKEMQQSRLKTFSNKLFGGNDIENAFKKMDNMSQEEVRMAQAQILASIDKVNRVDKKANETAQWMAHDLSEMKDDMNGLKDIMVKTKDDVVEIKERMYEMKDDVGEMKVDVSEMKWDQIEQRVREWFSPPDTSEYYNTARRACSIYQGETETNKWFFESSIFKEWELIGSLLWIHGKLGSGKSVLCSSIIERVISLRDNKRASLAFFFLVRDEERDKGKNKDVRNVLTSLLIQFSAHLDPCREIISRIYSSHGKGAQQPSIAVLTECLREVLVAAAQQPIYVIIDALDECPNFGTLQTPRAEILGLLKDLVDMRIPNLYICVTSCPEDDIEKVLKPLAYNSVSLHDESGQKKEISDYVKTAVNSMGSFPDEDRKLVVEVLTEKVDGMFQWVSCQLNDLRDILPGTSIQKTLDQLPSTLDDTYTHVLGRIPAVNQAQVHRLLQCLVVAVRPLLVEELAELLAFEFDEGQGGVPKYPADRRQNVQVVHSVLSKYPSLVVKYHGSQAVQFSHFSVKKYLMSVRFESSIGDFSLKLAHTIVARASLRILLHDHVDRESVKGFPLAEYAAENWVMHAQFEDVASHVKDGMVSLFDCDEPHFTAWVGIYNIDEPHQSSRGSPAKIPTPLYYASLCGFSDLVEHLAIKHPQDVNAMGGKLNFPLFAALAGKHIKVAEILLKHGAKVNIQGTQLRTPLHEAIRDVSVVRFLLEHGADVRCRQDDLRTPLHLAAYYGELKVVRELVKHNADVDSQDNEGKTPLYLLFEDSDRDDDKLLDVVRLLLKHHATDADIWTKTEWTLLHAATFWGRLKIVRALLDGGANPNQKNKQGETPLYLVSRGKYNSQERGGIASLLLERGAKVDSQKKNSATPLHSAAFRGMHEIAQVLLSNGANADAKNDHGETPLHLVARGEYETQEDGDGISQLLLKHGANVHAQDKDHDTPLHFAAYRGRLKIVQLLLDRGADPKAENEQGGTPLHRVSQGKYSSQHEEVSVSIVWLLLEHGADAKACNKDKSTPLHSAAFRGRLEIAQVLLNHCASTVTENYRGETPLHLVARGEYETQEHGDGITQLLLKHGANVHARDKDHDTPLHLAVYRGRLKIVQLLLDRDADPKAENEQGETPLHRVSQGKYSSQLEEDGLGIVRLLLGRGADAKACNKDKSTPLHSAAFRGRLEIAQVLLNHCASTVTENYRGETPLHLVARGEYETQEHGDGIAQLLLKHGANVHARDKDHDTPLHLAVYRGRLKIVQLLLDRDADPKAENEQGETPLHRVSQGKYSSQLEEDGLGIVRLLLGRGADAKACNKDKSTPLHSAAFRGRLDIAQILLNHGANACAENHEGENPLHLVARGEYETQEHGDGIAQLLLKHGANVHAQDKDHNTPLHFASYMGRLKIVQLLLDHNADPNVKNAREETPLHRVSQGKYTSQLKEDGVNIALLFLKRGVDANVRKKNKFTPLHSAAFRGRLEIAQVLLNHGANAGAENYRGDTPLHLVAGGKYETQERGDGITRLLLEHSANVHAQDKDHDTPLHFAAYMGRLKIVQLLLDHNADPNVKNAQGETPLHRVSNGKYSSQLEEDGVNIALLFLKRGVDANVRKKNKFTPLHSAAFRGRFKIAKVLLDHGANIHAQSNKAETPLHLASRGKYDSESQGHGVNIARLLLEGGADMNAPDKDKATPLHLARDRGCSDITKVLLDYAKEKGLGSASASITPAA